MKYEQTPRLVKVYPHGDNMRYVNNRCRCQECREAHRRANAQRQRAIAYGNWDGLVDPVGIVRRVQALSVVGWSTYMIAEKVGCSAECVRAISRGDRGQVRSDIAAAIRQVYDAWCTEDGPSHQARSWARKRGWLGPEAWTDATIDDPDAEPHAHSGDFIDEVRVHRALSGTNVKLTDAEAQAALLAGIAQGEPAWKVRHRLHIGEARAARLLAASADADGEVAA